MIALPASQPGLDHGSPQAAPVRTYGSLDVGVGMWIIRDLEPHVAMRLKQVFPRIAKAQTGIFSLSDDLVTCADLDWFIQRYPLAMSTETASRLRLGRVAFEQRQAEMERIRLPDYVPNPLQGWREGKALRHYQAQAVDLIAARRAVLVGDEVGLGKTIVTAGACLLPDALPAVVVVQTHLQKQWAEKLETFTTLRAHSVKVTKPYDLPPADVYLFRYSQLRGWVDTFAHLGHGLVAYDEIQELRTGRGSDKGMAAHALSQHARMRIGLSATPIYNYGSEIYNVMQFIDDRVLGTSTEFTIEWCGYGGKINDPQALGTYMREQNVFLRRTKADVGMEMDPVNRIVEYIDYDAKAVKSVEDLAHALALKATSGAYMERGQAARELDMMMRQVTGVSKAKQVAQFVRILVESGEPVLLAGWHRAVYDIWLKELRDLNPVMYTGSESTTQKEAAKQAFISGASKLMIISLRSGAGLDGLQHCCSTVVFGELDWSPGIHHQLIGRLDRDGQKQPVTAFFLVVDEGSDPPVMDVLGLKASQQHSILDPSIGVQQVHTDKTRLRSLVERYLTKRSAGGVPQAAHVDLEYAAALDAPPGEAEPPAIPEAADAQPDLFGKEPA